MYSDCQGDGGLGIGVGENGGLGRLKEGTYLGDFSVFEALLDGDGVPVDVSFVSGVLDYCVKEHCLSRRRLGPFGWGFLRHEGAWAEAAARAVVRERLEECKRLLLKDGVA